MSLREKIVHEIQTRGPIPFSRYMELCLYDEDHGYYSTNATQFGKVGDFFTSSDVHAVFGRLLARQFDEMWRTLGSPDPIVLRELGPGRGLFAQDVLDWSRKKFPAFFHALHYQLIERSPALRAKIAQTLHRHLANGKAVVQSDLDRTQPRSPDLVRNHDLGRSPDFPSTDPASTTFPRTDFGWRSASSAAIEPASPDGALAPEVPSPPNPQISHQSPPTILFANEFFDALPVEVITAQGSLRIDSRDQHFLETWAPPSPDELEFLDRYSIHPQDDERIEIPLAAQRSAYSALRSINCGFFLAIDYGYTRPEQLAGRHRGTLKAIRQHSVSANPYQAPGDQDLTADVNFTALAAIAEQLGWHSEKLITQSQFLLGIGESTQFADAFEDTRLPQERAKVALQLKHLVTPAGMGESFHVLVASKGVDQEKASNLAGLSFGRP